MMSNFQFFLTNIFIYSCIGYGLTRGFNKFVIFAPVTVTLATIYGSTEYAWITLIICHIYIIYTSCNNKDNKHTFSCIIYLWCELLYINGYPLSYPYNLWLNNPASEDLVSLYVIYVMTLKDSIVLIETEYDGFIGWTLLLLTYYFIGINANNLLLILFPLPLLFTSTLWLISLLFLDPVLFVLYNHFDLKYLGVIIIILYYIYTSSWLWKSIILLTLIVVIYPFKIMELLNAINIIYNCTELPNILYTQIDTLLKIINFIIITIFKIIDLMKNAINIICSHNTRYIMTSIIEIIIILIIKIMKTLMYLRLDFIRCVLMITSVLYVIHICIVVSYYWFLEICNQVKMFYRLLKYICIRTYICISILYHLLAYICIQILKIIVTIIWAIHFSLVYIYNLTTHYLYSYIFPYVHLILSWICIAVIWYLREVWKLISLDFKAWIRKLWNRWIKIRTKPFHNASKITRYNLNIDLLIICEKILDQLINYPKPTLLWVKLLIFAIIFFVRDLKYFLLQLDYYLLLPFLQLKHRLMPTFLRWQKAFWFEFYLHKVFLITLIGTFYAIRAVLSDKLFNTLPKIKKKFSDVLSRLHKSYNKLSNTLSKMTDDKPLKYYFYIATIIYIIILLFG